MVRILVAFLLLLLLGCSSSATPQPSPPVPAPEVEAQPSSSFSAVDLSGLVCSDGSPWRLYVSKGDPKKVLLNFQGGGACWNESTCNSGVYSPGVNSLELIQNQGVFDRSNPNNPFYGWTHVFVPYCSADIHWGNSSKTYGNRTIQHRGAVNSRAALNWMFDNYPTPQQVMVSGCSAGAYGAALWSAYVMNRYSGASVRVWADAGVGVVTDNFAGEGFKSWQAEQAIPDFIPTLSAARSDASRIRLPDLYRAIAAQFPSARLSQYTSQFDGVQTVFYSLMGGNSSDWSRLAQANLSAIKQGTPNFSSFTASGGSHCVSVGSGFYTAKVGNTLLTDWLRQLMGGTQPTDVRP